MDPDALILIALLLVVVCAILMPPGPGSPLRAPVPTQ